jgi:CBS domain-containing protein
MRAIDVMTPSVLVAAPEMTVQAAAKLLAENHISGMPVSIQEGGSRHDQRRRSAASNGNRH